MIDVSPEIATVLLLAAIFVGILLGYPLAIPTGAAGLFLGYLLLGDKTFGIYYSRFFSLLHSYVLLAVPCFVFMGLLIQRSGIAENMYAALYMWLGRVRGGLGVITIALGTILAATMGIVGASVSILTVLAVPAMVKRGYDKGMACGAACAGGALGVLIPPSVMIVIYGEMALLSVGKLLVGAVFPGLLLSSLYSSYFLVRALLQPSVAPAASQAERAVPYPTKIRALVVSLFPPVILILAVLGTIFLGIAPPTEAAAVGAFATLVLTFAYRKLTWDVLRHAMLNTLRLNGMILLIGGFSFAYVGVFLAAGGGEVVERLILAAPGGAVGSLILIMLIVFILGFFINEVGIVFLMIPIVAPIIETLGFNPIWFGLLILVNLQTSLLTPPMAPAIFYLRGTVDPELNITTGDIIRGVFPFVGLILIGLTFLIIFPEIVLWLPGKMIR